MKQVIEEYFNSLDGLWRLSVVQPLNRPFYELSIKTPSGAQLIRRIHSEFADTEPTSFQRLVADTICQASTSE